MQNIVLATDFSEASENAYRYTLVLGSKARTQIFVAHIFRHKSVGTLSEDQRKRYYQHEFEEFRQRTIRFSRLYPDSTSPELLAHCEVSSDIEEGHATRKLIELTERHQADLLILGAKRHPGLFKKLFGHVSQRLIYSPASPVLIVPEAYKGGFPLRAGALCFDKADEDSLSLWTKSSELLVGVELVFIPLRGKHELGGQSHFQDEIHTESVDKEEVLRCLSSERTNIIVIQSLGKMQEERKKLIHFLYDRLNVPMLCIPGKTFEE